MKEYRKIINVIGLRRAGIHAVVNWVLAHFENATFINDCSKFLYKGYYSPVFYHNGCKTNAPLTGKKDALILGHEETTPEKYRNKFYLKTYQTALKDISFDSMYHLVVIRDPFNHGASRYRLWGSFGESFAELYSTFIEEFEGRTSYFKLPGKLIWVLYNSWFTESSYRKEISGQIDEPHTDSGKSSMLPYGNGSSFRGMSLNGRAEELKVLDRWKNYLKDTLYQKVFQEHPEICNFSEKVFKIKPIFHP